MQIADHCRNQPLYLNLCTSHHSLPWPALSAMAAAAAAVERAAVVGAKELVDQLAPRLSRAKRIVVFTGAGVSTASGIPDYRGPQGVWETRQPVWYNEFMSSEDAKRRYWQQKTEDWFAFGRSAQPNAVHHAVRKLELAGKLHLCATQNVDGLHAAVDTTRLAELHGTGRRVECQRCGLGGLSAPLFQRFRQNPTPPTCTSCEGPLKLASISFGQPLRDINLLRTREACVTADLIIALGTTLSVEPAASLALEGAEAGAEYIIVNKGQTEHDGFPEVALRLEGDVMEVFPPAVDEALIGTGLA
eukprot:jgi/Chlat1/106/Chrsp1S03212